MTRRIGIMAIAALVGLFPALAIGGVAAAQNGCYPSCPVTTPLHSGSPSQAPISAATSVHTGEPWAGSLPYVVGVSSGGSLLVGGGLVLRRRRRSATIS